MHLVIFTRASQLRDCWGPRWMRRAAEFALHVPAQHSTPHRSFTLASQTRARRGPRFPPRTQRHRSGRNSRVRSPDSGAFPPRDRAEQWPQPRELMESGIEPKLIALRRQDHRHAVVHVPHQFVRLGGEDRAAIQRLALGTSPTLPQSGEGEDRVIGHGKAEGQLLLALALPLVKSIGRNQAAPREQRVAKRGPLGRGLRPRVDHLVADCRLLGPPRHKPPAKPLQPPHGLNGILAHHGDLLPRRHVVTRRPLRIIGVPSTPGVGVLGRERALSAEAFFQNLFLAGQPEASTHDLFPYFLRLRKSTLKETTPLWSRMPTTRTSRFTLYSNWMISCADWLRLLM